MKNFLSYKREYSFILGLLLISILISLPLFQLKSIKIHNGDFAIIKVASMYQSWISGDLLGRWTPSIIHGYGYPSFNYYAPFFFYVSSGLSMVLQNIILGFNLSLFFFLFVSACTMYVYTKEFWGIEGAFLSAVAYLLIPYHILDLYVRGSTGELVVFALLPLFFWAVYRLTRETKIIYFLISAVCLGALLTAHNVMMLFVLPLAFIYFVFILFQKSFHWRWIVLLGGIFVFAFGLAAYFWLPVVMEKGYIQIERDVVGAFTYTNHFVYWDQLLYPPWGFEGSVPGRNDSMSFQIGPLHLILLSIFIIRLKHLGSQRSKVVGIVGFWLVVLLFSIFMTLEFSNFIWKVIPTLAFLQFPWRFLLLVAFAVSFLVGGIVCSFSNNLKLAIVLGASFLIIIINIGYCRALAYEDLSIKNPRQYLYDSYPMDNMEYLPKGVKLINFTSPENRLEITSGQGEVLSFKNDRDLNFTYKVQVKAPLTVLFHTYYFPGWEVYINQKRVEKLIENPFGLISFTIPQGEQSVQVVFRSTLVRTIGEMASLVFLIGGVVIFLFRRKIDQRLKSP